MKAERVAVGTIILGEITQSAEFAFMMQLKFILSVWDTEAGKAMRRLRAQVTPSNGT